MVISGLAFAVWIAASVAFYALCDTGSMLAWYLAVPAAVMPSFWCVYGWFASRRAKPNTSGWLTLLAVPVLLMGLVVLCAVVVDAVEEPFERSLRSAGMGMAVMGGCCWELAFPFGLASFIWGIVLQVKSLRQPFTEL